MVKPFKSGTSSGALQQRIGPSGHWSPENPVPSVRNLFEILREHERERMQGTREGLGGYEARQSEEAQRAQKKGKGSADSGPSETGIGEARSSYDRNAPNGAQSGKGSEDTATSSKETVSTSAKLTYTATKTSSFGKPFSEYEHNLDVRAPPDREALETTTDVPLHGERTNVLFHPTPSVSLQPIFTSIERRAHVTCLLTFAGIVVFGKLFNGSLMGVALLAFVVASASWLWMMSLVRKGRDMEWRSESFRGEMSTANLIPESVEWMNSFLSVFWGVLNPEMFAGIGDTIEDVMQTSMPKMVENVRVAELVQGTNPFRVLSIRSLPDSHLRPPEQGAQSQDSEDEDSPESGADRRPNQCGYYNLECSFKYQTDGLGTTSAAKAANVHMLLVFYLGIKGLFGIPFPVFVELVELVGTIRLRLEMSPEPPFAQNMTASLMGLPHIRAGCTPMARQGLNILNLPLISNFVNYAISATANLYVAPKSISFDLRSMLRGDLSQKDSNAIGICWVEIHRARGLSKQDIRASHGGGCDAYINLSFSKYAMPIYCTRVILDDLNPVFQEFAALLVTQDMVQADERLSLELWDSDRTSADDMVGNIEVPIQDLMRQRTKMQSLTSSLVNKSSGKSQSSPGLVEWKVGFFGKPHFRPAMRSDQSAGFGDDSGIKQNNTRESSVSELDAAAYTPPDPLWPSGVMNIVIREIRHLELEEIEGTHKDRRTKQYDPARRYGEQVDEEGKDLPTSYCTVLLNDQLVYRTRSKAVTSKPIFNAGVERFLRDWRSAVVTVTVRDQRHRQHDPILGVVPLKISDILETSSECTRWYALSGGIAYGKIQISLLFRSVETRLPPQLMGWDVGTFKLVSSPVTVSGDIRPTKLKVWMSNTPAVTLAGPSGQKQKPRKPGKPGNGSSGSGSSGSSISSAIDVPFNKTTGAPSVCIPIQQRYRSSVVFELKTTETRSKYYAVIWLRDFVDNEDISVDTPIWYTRKNRNSAQRLTLNYITEANWEEVKRRPGLEDLVIVGRLQFTFRFDAGLDECHARAVIDNDSRETFETWEACVAENVRPRVVSRDIPETIERLHEASLLRERDVLRWHASEEEKRRVLSEQGGVDVKNFTEDEDARYIETLTAKTMAAAADSSAKPSTATTTTTTTTTTTSTPRKDSEVTVVDDDQPTSAVAGAGKDDKPTPTPPQKPSPAASTSSLGGRTLRGGGDENENGKQKEGRERLSPRSSSAINS